jgi:cytochrome c oxidase subunit 3
MANTSDNAGHFVSAEQQREAGSLGVWLFLVMEIVFFAGLMAFLALYRVRYPELFAGTQLDFRPGAAGSFLLICGSLTMAMATRAQRLGETGQVFPLVAVTGLCGAAFIAIFGSVFGSVFASGGVMGGHNAIVGFYVCLAGLHAVHVLAASVFLLSAGLRAKKGDCCDTCLAKLGPFWHLGTLLWFHLYPLLFLI